MKILFSKLKHFHQLKLYHMTDIVSLSLLFSGFGLLNYGTGHTCFHHLQNSLKTDGDGSSGELEITCESIR
jgi:hypothetical protein